MDGLLGRVIAQIRAMSLLTRAGVLLLVAAVIGGLVAGSASGAEDPARLHAVLLAFTVCTLSSLAALVLSLLWHGTPNGVIGALAGMGIGLFLPVATAIVVQQANGDLAKAGFYGWTVLFYLVLLTVKTTLVAPGFAPAQAEGVSRDDDFKPPARKSGV